MSYYPILLDLRGQTTVVVGGGQVAERKIETLLEHGAEVHVITKELTPTLRDHVEAGKITWIGEKYDERALKGAFLVIAATDNPVLNRQVSEDAKRKGILINAVDQPSDCSFIVPSVLRRGDLLIAVSTSGCSPMLAKKVRRTLEKQFGDEYEMFLNLMGALRKEILAQGFSQDENHRIFRALVESPILEAIGQRRWNDVASMVNEITRTEWSAGEISKLVYGGS
jgi:precorrin-2 dehydrogenase/sirohydrochlorin ferrochelatase